MLWPATLNSWIRAPRGRKVKADSAVSVAFAVAARAEDMVLFDCFGVDVGLILGEYDDGAG